MKMLLSILSAFLAVGIIAGAWYYFFRTEPQAIDTGAPITLPGSEDVPGSTSPGTNGGAATMTLVGTEGAVVTTRDFLHNGSTIADTSNPGRYLIAGDLGYCVANPEACRAGDATDFNIFYDSVQQSFTIGLLEEPLKDVRRAAEQTLLAALGITESEACKLNYYVGTTSAINSFFDGKNLGFSFCPSATELP